MEKKETYSNEFKSFSKFLTKIASNEQKERLTRIEGIGHISEPFFFKFVVQRFSCFLLFRSL